MILTEEFLSKYPDNPPHQNELGSFVMYRTYLRWLEGKKRRENWKENVKRVVEYSMQQHIKRMAEIKFPIDMKAIREEAEILYDNIFNLRQFLSGRTHWVGGAESGVAEKFPLANFNCSFLNISKYDDTGDLFYLLLVGTGVGFKSTRELANNIPPIRDNFTVIHNPYVKRYPLVKEPNSQMFIVDNGKKAVIHVGDSKEGWVLALRYFFNILTKKDFEDVETISIYYDYIRPKGSRLKTFGGTASGYEPLKEMFEGIEKTIKGTLDNTIAPPERINDKYVKLRPIHFLDIGNLVGYNVVVGGVRRTAEIFLGDANDLEIILAKYGINGIWDDYDESGNVTRTAEEKHNEVMNALQKAGFNVPDWMKKLKLRDSNARPLHHRRMSNNSVIFESKPSRELLHALFIIMRNEGEPGFFNIESARKRRPNVEGINPCAEILLDSYGVCNLTTVNVMAFVKWNEEEQKYVLDYSGLQQAQALSARAGVRMTLLDLELPHWDEVQKRDRLIGTSLTGWYDAMDLLGYTEEQEEQLLELLSDNVRMQALRYAVQLRIPVPLLDTTIKPEGTLSQVAGGVSSGLHKSHAPYYIRRIRINANDPLVQVVKELGWNVYAEVGTMDIIDPEELKKPEVIEQARTLVVEFPIKSGSKRTKNDLTVDEQFDTYFRFQRAYTSHNSSNTITIKPHEWERAEEIVWDNWDDFIAVSFLAHDGGSYTLAPYEEITEEQYEEMKKRMKPFDPELLVKYETGEDSDLEGLDGCEGGACPIR